MGFALASWLCLPVGLLAQERSYYFSLEGPDALFGTAGEVVEAEYFGILGGLPVDGSQGPLEVAGWAFGVVAHGARITAITVVGTDAEPARTAGFERSELTTGSGNEGAISKVIYSSPPQSVLPVKEVARIARIKVESVIPVGWETAWLLPKDGLRGSIDTVELFVLEPGGERKVPGKSGKHFNLVADVPTATFMIRRVGSSMIVGQAGSIARAELLCEAAGWFPSTGRLNTDGWALAVAADGAVITQISVAGTAFELELRDGFVRNELTAGTENKGAVSIVTMPPSLSGTIQWKRYWKALARITVESEIPVGGQEVAVSYRDGLRSLAGMVVNHVLVGGSKITPTLEGSRLYLSDIEPCGPVAVGFSTNNTFSGVPFEGILGGARAAEHKVISTPVGESGAAVFYANYVLKGTTEGVAGWALSIEVSGEASPWTVSFKNSAGYQTFGGGFQRTTLADPERGGGRKGFVSAIVGNFDGHPVLYSESTVSVLELEVRADRPQAGETLHAEMRFADGLIPSGMGQPVQNYVSVAGNTVRPCNLDQASLSLEFTPIRRFIRGDATKDLAVDISDAIASLEALFGGAPLITCLDAADVNDGGGVDISDSIYLLSYLFLGGSAPLSPFPNCGPDDTGDSFPGCAQPPTCP